MDNRKRFKKWLQKGMSLILVLAVLAPLCIVPAHAEKIGVGDDYVQLDFTVGVNAGFGYYYGSDRYHFLGTVYYSGMITKETIEQYALAIAQRNAFSYYGSALGDAVYNKVVVGSTARNYTPEGHNGTESYDKLQFTLYLGGDSTADLHVQRILLDTRGNETGVVPTSGCGDSSCTYENCALHMNYQNLRTTADPEFKNKQIFNDALAKLGTTFEYNGLQYVYESSKLEHIGDDYRGNDRGLWYHGIGQIKLYYIRSPKASAVSYQLTGAAPDGVSVPTPSGQMDGDPVAVKSAAAVAGYDFSGWTTSNAVVSGGSFTMPTHDVIFSGSYTPRTDTPYTVEFYKQDAPGSSSYTKQDSDTVHSTGTTDTQIRAALNMAELNKKYEHYSLTDTSKNDTTTISGNGGAVLKLYYDKTAANVSYLYSGNVPANAPAAPVSAERQINSIVSVEHAPTLPGYDFSGWTTSDAVVSGGGFVMPSNDVTLTGSWTPRNDTPYTVQRYLQNIDNDGYTLVDTDSYTGTTDTVAVAPEKNYPGFTMVQNVGRSVPNNMIQGDGSTTLKIYYDRKVSNVTYSYLGNTDSTPPELPTTTSYRYGQSVSIAAAPTMTGYDFGGWETADVTISDGGFTMPDGDVRIIGSWLPRPDTSYKVEYYLQELDGSYRMDKSETRTGITGTQPSAVAANYEGYTETDESKEAAKNTTINSDGSTVLKVYFDRNRYKLTYAYTGDVDTAFPTVPEQAAYRYGETVTIDPVTPTLQGYDFGGWATNDVTMTDGTFEMPAKDVTVTGAWYPQDGTPFKVLYYHQNLDLIYSVEDTGGNNLIYSIRGTTDDNYSLIYSIDGAGVVGNYIPGIHRDFDGFTETTASLAAEKTKIASDGSTVVSLYYDRNIYSLRYDYSGSTPEDAPELPPEQSFKYGSTIALPSIPTTTSGKVFTGWTVNGEAAASPTFEMPSVDTVITGVWADAPINDGGGSGGSGGSSAGSGDDGEVKKEKLPVAFVSDGSTVDTKNVDPGAKVDAPPTPQKAGYSFAGWYADSNCTDPWDFEQRTITAATVLYAKWTPEKLTVSFNSNGGGAIMAQTVSYGDYAVEPTAPKKTGCTFAGWYADSGLSETWSFTKNAVTADTVLFAKWTPEKFTVSFKSDGGSAVAVQTVSYGDYAVEPTAPKKTGYTFAGWYADSGLTKAWSFTRSAVTSNTVLYAAWYLKATHNTVRFNSDGGSEVEAQTVARGGYVQKPTPPVKTGCTFAGWYADSGLTRTWDFAKDTVVADITLYAAWDFAVAYNTVNFNSNGGSAVAAQTLACGGHAVEPTAPVKTGYTFAGWYADSGLSESWDFAKETIISNTVLYAKWNANVTAPVDEPIAEHHTFAINMDLVKGCLAALLLVLSLLLFIWQVVKRAKVQIYDETGKHLLCTSDVKNGKIDIDNVLATASEPIVMVQINKFYALRHIGKVISICLEGNELYKDKLGFDNKYLIKTK